MPDEPRKAVRKPWRKKPEQTGETRRRRRPRSDNPDARPPGFPLPYIHPEPTDEESTDVDTDAATDAD